MGRDREPAVPRSSESRVVVAEPRADRSALERSGGLRDAVTALPRGEGREPVLHEGRTYRLRGSEVDVLTSVGAFRSVFVEDLAQARHESDRFRVDLQSLTSQGLLARRSIPDARHRTMREVVSLTATGQALLDRPSRSRRRTAAVACRLGEAR